MGGEGGGGERGEGALIPRAIEVHPCDVMLMLMPMLLLMMMMMMMMMTIIFERMCDANAERPEPCAAAALAEMADRPEVCFRV
jgi:hypothetical protein